MRELCNRTIDAQFRFVKRNDFCHGLLLDSLTELIA
ncbi:hypothetical protein CNECB9_5450012 [Cupriavidus necator]|uniref:Uncharacterized protein n=1 Tax=Cupriavidus necator TaxID=106590 RepID=A0A1K0IQG0_CUPNE|nr:hypothetical protein CNECB9_5450012 [Cupriavidus necator]